VPFGLSKIRLQPLAGSSGLRRWPIPRLDVMESHRLKPVLLGLLERCENPCHSVCRIFQSGKM